jgi:hypothetical protein
MAQRWTLDEIIGDRDLYHRLLSMISRGLGDDDAALVLLDDFQEAASVPVSPYYGQRRTVAGWFMAVETHLRTAFLPDRG